MVRVEATAASVDMSGTIVSLFVPPGHRRFRVEEAFADHDVGSATCTRFIFTTCPSATPGQCDPADTILDLGNQVANLANIKDDNNGAGYAHDIDPLTGEVRVHILPDAGADNDYTVAIVVGRRF